MENIITYMLSGLFDSSISKLLSKTFSPKRKVEYFELELYAEDYFFTVINGEQCDYTKNSVIIAKPGDERYGKLHFKSKFIHIELNDCPLKRALQALPSTLKISNIEKYHQAFDKISMLAVSYEKNQCQILSELYKLLHLLEFDCATQSVIRENNLPKNAVNVNQSARFIEENYNRNISLEEIAKSASLSPYYFHSLFKKIYGVSPLDYLTEVRIANAKHQLLSTELSVTEVAFNCGFNSQPYFNYTFKKMVGETPLKFRVNNKLKF